MALDLGLAGLASGFDWRSLVDQLADVERAPGRRMRSEQGVLAQRKSAYGSMVTALSALKTRVETLKDPSLFNSRTTLVGDGTLATATAASGAALGSYAFNVVQLATASSRQGAANVGQPLSATNDVSGVVLSGAAFPTPVTAGTFTVNGKQISIATSDNLQAVFDKISTATGGSVSGSYDSATDRITLASAGEIVLGTATDSSNFLQAARLANNGTGTVTSSATLGTVRTTASLASANFATAVSDGGSGAGEFKINGVSIAFNTATDTVATVIARINAANAGVTASYDSVNDRFQLTSKATGDLGIALEDVTGNFLAATGLAASTLTRGQDLLYTLNGGAQLTSHSNTVTEASSGLAGVSITALRTGSTTVEVGSDSAKIKTAINDFLAEYNKVQSLIDTQTASSTDAKGKVTAGVLAADNEAGEVARQLRSLANATLGSLSGTVRRLASLGIDSSGTDNSLSLKDATRLDAALSGNLSEVEQLFTHSTGGLAVTLGAYLEKTVGEEGSLIARQGTLTRQISDIDTQVADLERIVESNRERMITSFIAMEQAQARVNQQLQFLSQRFGS
ncbi:MAG: hypothetical protein RJA22_2638 [Verrucomicrobiota bacterium]|jgi:flagellar hook-associated protein 2